MSHSQTAHRPSSRHSAPSCCPFQSDTRRRSLRPTWSTRLRSASSSPDRCTLHSQCSTRPPSHSTPQSPPRSTHPPNSPPAHRYSKLQSGFPIASQRSSPQSAACLSSRSPCKPHCCPPSISSLPPASTTHCSLHSMTPCQILDQPPSPVLTLSIPRWSALLSSPCQHRSSRRRSACPSQALPSIPRHKAPDVPNAVCTARCSPIPSSSPQILIRILVPHSSHGAPLDCFRRW
mmetsp:Transcript_58183/g.137160  ORF Transcript_58183/g.137160 Transcript_58183/m.137160 type:complete len:233 (-) Transcript_58183:1059-1757(-)